MEVVYEDLPPRVDLKGKNRIVLKVRPESTRTKREEVLAEWYRNQLKIVVDDLLEKWQEKIGVYATSWGIKRMKTRWGTCSQKAGRIWLNLELAKKPIPYIEYVLIHELIHLTEKRHNEKFTKLMTTYLPNWRSAKEELNSLILSHEEWSY